MSQNLILSCGQTARTMQQGYYVWRSPFRTCLLEYSKIKRINWIWGTLTTLWLIAHDCRPMRALLEKQGWCELQITAGISFSECHGWNVQSVRKQCQGCRSLFPDQCFNTCGLSVCVLLTLHMNTDFFLLSNQNRISGLFTAIFLRAAVHTVHWNDTSLLSFYFQIVQQEET